MKDPALARRLEAIGFNFKIVGRRNILTEPHLHRCVCCSAMFGDHGAERMFVETIRRAGGQVIVSKRASA